VLRQTITVVEVEEAVALGAALLGGLGAGVFPDVAGALASLALKRSEVPPEAELVAAYDRRYDEVYTRIYPALRALNHAVDAIEAR
jgi:xylulokinase